jgi:flagellar basal-body rod protein FlgG
MITQQRRQDTLSNNIANAQTPGFKQDQAMTRSFPELLVKRMGGEEIKTQTNKHLSLSNQVGPLTTGVYVHETLADQTQGTLQETNMTTDMALVNGNIPDQDGALFFTVQNAEGDVRYTRNGNFTVDGEGYLTTNQGYYVLADDGNRVFTNGENFAMTPEGVLTTGAGQIPLQINYTANQYDLIKDDENLFTLTEEDGDVLGEMENARGNAGVTFSVSQGFLEASNVDSGQTMVEMMQAYRLFESNQQVVKAYDKSMEIAVNQIGRLN